MEVSATFVEMTTFLFLPVGQTPFSARLAEAYHEVGGQQLHPLELGRGAYKLSQSLLDRSGRSICLPAYLARLHELSRLCRLPPPHNLSQPWEHH